MNPASSSIQALIAQAAAAWPGEPYAVDGESGQVLRHAELAASCGRIASWLQQGGLAPGATVSLVLPNGLQTLRLLLGAMAAGYTVNPINLLAQPEQMRYVLEHSDAALVCVAPEWEARIRQLLASIERPIRLLVVDPAGASLPDEPATALDLAPLPGDRPALLMYTSGTTGRPKGVVLSQGALAANARAISLEHDLGPRDRVLGVLPLYHINAFVVTMLAPLAHGGSVAMVARFSSHRFWEQVQRHACTWINLVPTMIAYLLESDVVGAPQGLRFCRSASAPLAPEQHRAFEARFGIAIIETMGLTESAAPVFSNGRTAAERRIASVGRASGCEACVLDRDLQPLPPGETGEIAVRGPQLMSGYYKDEAATRSAFTADGWLRTGDLGHRDADGFYYISGRIKELIIKGGENIAPREIDEVLLRHPAVLDAAAVGVPDKLYGQEIAACIVLREGAVCELDDLRVFCVEHLGRYKTPKLMRFVEDLPRGPSGKVQRLKMQAIFAAD
ncbi:MAG: AMP-binding protein [Burkholderiales bacterium]|nr:AMP-binding protein [Burkholderiales bacterium]MDE1926455.1 AMP-binding protein [Burkholderiales bacterium]MDE2159751.1 AMP-binding protein [Burkholderiales bacterium]MDE2503009.1 AMP-binding protein [Burkholderiales bacterium]